MIRTIRVPGLRFNGRDMQVGEGGEQGLAGQATGAVDRWLLVSDLDDTLLSRIPDDLAENTGFGRFAALVSQTAGLLVVINSSRPRKSVLRTLATREAVRRAVRRLDFSPDGLITAMGTEILIYASDGEADEAWQRRFAGWDREIVDRALAPLAAEGVTPHADEFQARFKASYAVPGEIRDRVKDVVESLPQASRVVISGKTDFDVLPPNAGKGAATLFVAQRFGIDVGKRLIVAGDSANDLEMFAVSKRGIIVSNARSELAESVSPEAAFRSASARAAGVVEGLVHWGAAQEKINT